MSDEPLVTDAIRALIGVASEPAISQVEKGHIRRFVESVGDTNPLFTDDEVARGTKWGAITAPPTFVYVLPRNPLPEPDLAHLPRLLNGGDEFAHHLPVRVGDTIVSVTRYADFYEKSGGLGRMLFVITETSYRNQHGALVATHRGTRIRY